MSALNDKYKEQCKNKIRAIGFEVDDNLLASFGKLAIDFSAVDPEQYCDYAINEIYTRGKLDGIKIIQDQIKAILGIKNIQ